MPSPTPNVQEAQTFLTEDQEGLQGRKRRRPDEPATRDAADDQPKPQLWNNLMSAASDERVSMDGVPADQRTGLPLPGMRPTLESMRPPITGTTVVPGPVPGQPPPGGMYGMGQQDLQAPPPLVRGVSGGRFGAMQPHLIQATAADGQTLAKPEMPEQSAHPQSISVPVTANGTAAELTGHPDAAVSGEGQKTDLDRLPPGASWPVDPAATAAAGTIVVADAAQLARYPMAQSMAAQPGMGYPQYAVAQSFLPYPGAVQTMSNTHTRAIVVPAPPEIMRQSVDSRTRVRCEPGTLGGRDSVVTSQKLWQKYGEKMVQNSRDKSGTSDGKQKKRLYFKCYNKSCPAKMIVDVDSTTGEELVPFLSGGAHTHTFEIAPAEVEG